MGSPLVPTGKIRGKHKLDSIVRDLYAGFSTKISVPHQTTTEQLHKDSLVNVTTQKFMGKRKGYYRYYYYKAYAQKKPEKLFVTSHPVHMQRKHKWEKP